MTHKGEKMTPPPPTDALRRVHAMDRRQCIEALTHFRDIPLDFDDAYLSGMSTERLRHLLAAALITVHRRRARAAAPRPRITTLNA